jgi:hypothetical protein
MSRAFALLIALLAFLTVPAAAAAAVELKVDKDTVKTVLGETFTIKTEIVNSGDAATDQLLAHLNVASLTEDVYVDPEDWSAERSQVVESLDPGETRSLTWEIQAVNDGSFDAYVVVLPNGESTSGKGPLVVSPPVHLDVAGRRTLNAGGALPVAIAVPILLGLLAVGNRLRMRRSN